MTFDWEKKRQYGRGTTQPDYTKQGQGNKYHYEQQALS